MSQLRAWMNGPSVSAITNAKKNTNVRAMLSLDAKRKHLPEVLINRIIVQVDLGAGLYGFATNQDLLQTV